MNINLTLVGQMITFIIFIWFTMKFVWPPLMRAMEARRKQIADGLAAGEEGERKLELAEIKFKEKLAEAKTEALHIIEKANQRSNQILDEAKVEARAEGERLLSLAQAEIEQSYLAAREELTHKIAGLAMAGAERIIHKNVDTDTNKKLIDDMINEVEAA